MARRFLQSPRGAVTALVSLLALTLLVAACSIAVDDVAVTSQLAATSTESAGTSAPGASGNERDNAGGIDALDFGVTGPSPGTSHWHAAYVVRVCDEVLTPFDSDADPLGIHSHADGLIHIHPFFVESGFENATLGLFADAMGLGLTTGELTMPGGGSWRDGDLCDGQPGQVFVDRWSGPSPEGSVQRIFEDLDEIRFEADGELYHIGFAPPDSPPVVPPAWTVLPEVSNLIGDPPDPWVTVPPEADPASVRVWPVSSATPSPCPAGAITESVADDATPTCFVPGAPIFGAGEAFEAAVPAVFNRQPAVDLTITPEFRQWIVSTFQDQRESGSDDGLALAIEVNGVVVTAPVLTRLPASDTRMVISGGMSAATAEMLASVLNG